MFNTEILKLFEVFHIKIKITVKFNTKNVGKQITERNFISGRTQTYCLKGSKYSIPIKLQRRMLTAMQMLKDISIKAKIYDSKNSNKILLCDQP